MKKITKKMSIILMTIAIVGIIGLCSICNRNKLRPIKEDKNRTLAMYVENEAGEYVISSNSEFPTEGYVLDHVECKNGGVVTQDSTTKKISASVTVSDSCNLYFARELTLAEILIAKANGVTVTEYESGNKEEMYTFKHNDLTTTTTDGTTTYTHSATQVASWTEDERTDYRYIGANPNNWVKFNDEDWRIIGVFTVETAAGNKEQLIKIIRNESIGSIAWDSNVVNEWSTSSLSTLLNTGDYYNRANTYASTGLNATARSQIEEVKWYLGGSSTYKNLGGPDYYAFERGETTCVTTGNCSGQPRSTNIIAKVGLMYPSDYAYTYANGVDNKCYTDGFNCESGQATNGWLHNSSIAQWTISPYAGSAKLAVFAGPYGRLFNDGLTSCDGVRPTVYLKSDIKIVSGIGTSSNPYILG